MRPDVKLGMVISMMVVLVAGGYYMYRDQSESPIPLAGGPESKNSVGAAREKLTTPVKSADARKKPAATRKSGEPQDRPRTGRQTPRVAKRSPAKTPRQRIAKRPTTAPKSTGAGSPVPADNKVATGADRRARPKRGTVADRNVAQKPAATPARTRTNQPSVPGQKPAGSKVAALNRAGGEQPTSPGDATQKSARRPVPLVGKRNSGADSPAKPAATPTKVAVETHRVQSGDTMSAIAESYYGSAKYTQFLIESNPEIQDPNRLQVGMTVKIPERPTGDSANRRAAKRKTADAQDLGKHRTYRVQPGDTFYGIAQTQLGDASRWQELFELNKEVVGGNAKRLQVGHVLSLPN